jgi:hypothetical protein
MPLGPVHHGSYGEDMIAIFQGFTMRSKREDPTSGVAQTSRNCPRL